MEKIYKISEKKLKELIRSDWELNELEVCGVDNWGGYEETEDVLDEEINEYIKTEFESII